MNCSFSPDVIFTLFKSVSVTDLNYVEQQCALLVKLLYYC